MSTINLDENEITIMLMDANYGVKITKEKDEQIQEINKIADILKRHLLGQCSKNKLDSEAWKWYNNLLKENKIKLLVPQILPDSDTNT
jgi:hypothetical protein